jgi:hypothetical protein
MMKEIRIGRYGAVALVDDDDFEILNQYKWSRDKDLNTSYGYRSDKGKWLFMHRVILGLTDPKIHVDHINGDGLDNRRCNLRTANHSQNQMNARKRKNCTSIYKGVSYDKGKGKWMACAGLNGKVLKLGLYTDEKEAARVYNDFAKKHYKEFARLNDV